MSLSLRVLLLATLLAGAKTTQAAEPKDTKDMDGYVVVEEDVICALADAPQDFFKKAHASFLKKSHKPAAVEIRKATAFMRLEASRATTEGKKLLNISIKELDQLAIDAEKDAVKEASSLNQAFAQAEHALAQHHYLKAMECKAMGAGPKIGHALTTSAMCVEHALDWSGNKVGVDTKEALKKAATLGDNLMTGTQWVAKEGGMAIDAVGVEIAKLGKLIETKKPVAKG
jgi:hypothetical protein